MKIYQTTGEVVAVTDKQGGVVRLEADIEPPSPTARIDAVRWPGTAYGTVYVTWVER